MSNIRYWSGTAVNNQNLTSGDGMEEGQLSSSVNDKVRAQMAAHRTQWEDAEWFDWGHTLVRTGAQSFNVSVTATQIYTPGRRLKMFDATTIYGEVIASSFAAGVTTVTVSSSNLTTSLTSGMVSIIDPFRNSLPVSNVISVGAATQAQMEAATAVDAIVTPGRQQYHPSAAKAWCAMDLSANVVTTTCSLLASHNVSFVQKASVGRITVNFTVPFSSANYTALGMAANGAGSTFLGVQHNTTASRSVDAFSLQVQRVDSFSLIDTTYLAVAFYGDQ